MRIARRGGLAILVALTVLLTAEAAPATALTVQRVWTVSLGSGGANGGMTMTAYTSGEGLIRYNLHGLKPHAGYTVQIRNGTCARLGSIAATLTPILTSTTGTALRGQPISAADLARIWTVARNPSFVVRIVSGTSIRCAAFGFVHATRVAVTKLGIDLPIVRGPSGYPYCNVAMYLTVVSQPLEPGITFIFAHARVGMFLPLLTQWKKDQGASMIGATIKVWTSNNDVVYYRIYKWRVQHDVMVGVTSLAHERLWLQTSTGPNTSYPKLIVEASRYQVLKTTYAAAHPTPHPINC